MVGIRIYDELSFWQVPTRKTLIAITTMSLLLCTIVGMSLFAGYSDHERCMLSLGAPASNSELLA
jgi:hypothetical protein